MSELKRANRANGANRANKANRAWGQFALFALFALACRDQARDSSPATQSPRRDSASAEATGPVREDEPKQWTPREVARRLSGGGLVVTDSGRTSLRHAVLAVEGRQMRVSGSDLQVFIYPDAQARAVDSDRLDSLRVAPADAIIEWGTKPHLIASGNLIAIHLTANDRLAERVRLILEAWHATP